MLALFFRLFHEELREKHQLPLLEVCCNAQVLHAGAKLISDLLVYCGCQFRAYQHVDLRLRSTMSIRL